MVTMGKPVIDREVERARKAFIRETAMRLVCIVDSGPATHDRTGHSALALTVGECWDLARQLWDAKPEDC